MMVGLGSLMRRVRQKPRIGSRVRIRNTSGSPERSATIPSMSTPRALRPELKPRLMPEARAKLFGMSR